MTKEIMLQDNVLTVHPKAQATKTSLVLAEDITQDEWEEVVGNLGNVEGAVHWWIGDAFSFADKKWGMYDKFLETSPFEKGTVKSDKWVAESIETSLRRDVLSHSHHKAVASLEPEMQDYFLGLAEEQGLTTRELSQAINENQLPKDGKVRLMIEPLDLTTVEKQKIIRKAREEFLDIEQAELVAKSIASTPDPKTRDRLTVMPFDRYEHNPDRKPIEETTTVPAVIWADQSAVVSITSSINRCIELVEKGAFPQEAIPFVIEKAKELIAVFEGE